MPYQKVPIKIFRFRMLSTVLPHTAFLVFVAVVYKHGYIHNEGIDKTIEKKEPRRAFLGTGMTLTSGKEEDGR